MPAHRTTALSDSTGRGGKLTVASSTTRRFRSAMRLASAMPVPQAAARVGSASLSRFAGSPPRKDKRVATGAFRTLRRKAASTCSCQLNMDSSQEPWAGDQPRPLLRLCSFTSPSLWRQLPGPSDVAPTKGKAPSQRAAPGRRPCLLLRERPLCRTRCSRNSTSDHSSVC